MLKVILKNVSPNEEEVRKIREIANSVKKKIIINDTKVEFGGSYAKNTWLSGMHDIDIYVKFDFEKFKDKNIDSILRKYLEKRFKIKVLHGSRDYFQIKRKKYIFEIIPILDIKKVENARNMTDASPFHVKWVKKNYNKEIRLSKAFCKAQGCYGAESHIRGFSGYALEILTIYYGGFMNFLKRVSKWKEKEIIGDINIVKELNKHKKESPLILIDPVDNNRNVAAALSREKYNLFIKSSKEFLKKPNKGFFIKKKFDVSKLKKRNMIVLDVRPLKCKEDVSAAKMFRAFRYIKKHLELNGFKLKDSGWNFENKLFWFLLENKKLSSKIRHYGPNFKFKKRLEDFKKKWKSYRVYMEDDRVYVYMERKYKNIKDFFKEFFKDKNLLKLVKRVDQKVYK